MDIFAAQDALYVAIRNTNIRDFLRYWNKTAECQRWLDPNHPSWCWARYDYPIVLGANGLEVSEIERRQVWRETHINESNLCLHEEDNAASIIIGALKGMQTRQVISN